MGRLDEAAKAGGKLLKDAAASKSSDPGAFEAELKKDYREFKQFADEKGGLRSRSVRFVVLALIVGLIVGCVIGAGVFRGVIESSAYKDADVYVVYGKIVDKHELTLVERDYTAEASGGSSRQFFGLRIPGTANSYVVRYVGDIKVAVDLSKSEFVSIEGNTVTLALEQPYIASNTPRVDESGVIYSSNNFLNPIKPEDVDAFGDECVNKVNEAAAGDAELFEIARTNAADELGKLFSVGLGGDYTVVIEWR